MRVLFVGLSGGMGKTFVELQGENFKIVEGISTTPSIISEIPVVNSFEDVHEEFDIIIDFSNRSLTDSVLDFAVERRKPLVIGTTSLSESTHVKILESSKTIPIMQENNYSIGVNALNKIVKNLTELLNGFDIELIEAHHNKKVDAPSGTAKMLLETIKNVRNLQEVYDRSPLHKKRGEDEIGVSSIRGGTIVGEHTVLFAGVDEVIEIKHSAHSKKIFANGAIVAAKFLLEQEPGLYNFSNMEVL